MYCVQSLPRIERTSLEILFEQLWETTPWNCALRKQCGDCYQYDETKELE